MLLIELESLSAALINVLRNRADGEGQNSSSASPIARQETEGEERSQAYNAGFNLYQQALLRQQMEDNHFVNMVRAQANRNALGGWRRDSNGDEYYEEGYI